MDTSVALVTTRLIEPETFPRVAVIVVEPGVTEVATPLEPELLPIVATAVTEEVQLTELVRSSVELSLKTPVALKVSVRPVGMPGLVEVTPIETRVAPVTVRLVDADKPPREAVIVVAPGLTAVAIPTEPGLLLMEAVPALAEFHVTSEEISCFEPSLKLPVAMNCCVMPIATLLSGGATEIAVS